MRPDATKSEFSCNCNNLRIFIEVNSQNFSQNFLQYYSKTWNCKFLVRILTWHSCSVNTYVNLNSDYIDRQNYSDLTQPFLHRPENRKIHYDHSFTCVGWQKLTKLGLLSQVLEGHIRKKFTTYGIPYRSSFRLYVGVIKYSRTKY